MNEIVNVLKLGFTDGIVWFPIVLAVGLIYRYLKIIDVSVDGITIISAIGFTLVYNSTSSVVFAFICTAIISVLCYSIVAFLVENLKINNILAGIIFTLILHSISVLKVGESVRLRYENLAFLNNFTVLVLIAFSLILLVEYLLNTIVGFKIKVVTDSLNFNSSLGQRSAKYLVYITSGVVLSVGVVIYTSQLGSARSGGGFEFLITALSSYLFVDKAISVLTRNIKQNSYYILFRFIQSPVFKSLIGSILFQITVNLIIFYTSNPVYWKLFFGLILLFLVSDFSSKWFQRNKTDNKSNKELSLSDISFSYTDTFKRNVVFTKLNLSIPVGLTLIWGDNGSGKSTLMKLIEGTLKPDFGDIYFNGINITNLPESARDVFFIPQVPYNSLSTNSTVFENIIAAKSFPLQRLLGIANERDVPGNFLLQKTQLAGSLSGGQAQVLNLELSKICNNSIIIADEPTSGMDISNFNRFLDYIYEQTLLGKTVVVVTHDSRFNDVKANHINLNTI